MSDRDPLDHERTFYAELMLLGYDLHDWYHEDPDGQPWMMVSFDFMERESVRDTLRVDYDGTSLKGGWSPACLNWDAETRAEEAHIDTSPPDGLDVEGMRDAQHAAAVAGEWFLGHIHARRKQ